MTPPHLARVSIRHSKLQVRMRPLLPRIAILSSVHEATDPRIFHKQARTLAAAGFEVHLFARQGGGETDNGDGGRVIVRDGVRLHPLPKPRSRWGRPMQWARLAWGVWRLRPRVVHIHDPELLPLLLVLKLALGVRAVYDAHEYYGAEVARRAWIPASLRLPAARLTSVVETFVARRIDAVVAVNEHMAAGFRRRGARRVIAAHNYPPAEYFQLDAPAEPIREPVVGYVGLLSPDRGLATVYAAAGSLARRVPDATVRVIGRVDWSGLSPSIPREASAWAARGVMLKGSIPAAAVPGALRSVRVGWIPFLDTGNNRRTIPLKLLEYMAAGKPVLASEIGFIAEIVRASGCGLLVSAEDADAHADALARLLTDDVLAQRMGEAGRRAVRERYTWAVEGRKLVTLYRALTGDR